MNGDDFERIGRVEWLIRVSLIGVAMAFVLLVCKIIDEGIPLDSSWKVIVGLSLYFLFVCLGVFFWQAMVKRLHDLNLSGWHIVWIFLPFINVFFVFFLLIMFLFIKGISGSNQYGEEPRPPQLVIFVNGKLSYLKDSLFSMNPVQKVILSIGIIPIFFIATEAIIKSLNGTKTSHSIYKCVQEHPLVWILSLCCLVFVELLIWEKKVLQNNHFGSPSLQAMEKSLGEKEGRSGSQTQEEPKVARLPDGSPSRSARS